MFALLGPNGGGKTTLFRIIATLLRPAAGSVRVFGADVRTDGAAVRRLLGVVFQSPALDKRLTVRENLRHHGHLYGLRGRPLRDRSRRRSRACGSPTAATIACSRCRAGSPAAPRSRRRCCPRPGSCCSTSRRRGSTRACARISGAICAALREAQGTTIVLTTHLMDEAEACDRVAILDSGRVVLSGRPGDLTSALGGDILTIESDRPDAAGGRPP